VEIHNVKWHVTENKGDPQIKYV